MQPNLLERADKSRLYRNGLPHAKNLPGLGHLGTPPARGRLVESLIWVWR
jgi:hypothetical protein